MKKILSISLTLMLSFLCMAYVPQERVYVSTDKDVYIAGERIWCSVFCLDGAEMSGFSSIAYVELLSEDSQAGCVKVALKNGRGAATLCIPTEIPSGNYRLVAYTSLNVNDKSHDYLEGSKILSVFNTMTTSRVEGGVEVVEKLETVSPVFVDDPSLDVTVKSDGNMILAFEGEDFAQVSISVCQEDGIPGNKNPDIRSFCNNVRSYSAVSADYGSRIPEYEGEIIRCRAQGGPGLEGKTVFISFPGESPDAYSADIRKDGTSEFFTQNIYGTRDVVCEIADGPSGSTVSLESPFITPDAGHIPVLHLFKSQEADLLKRSLVLQDDRTYGVDTLFSMIPKYEDKLFGSDVIEYILDDYTRFPVMEEIIIEFISELRVRKNSTGAREILVALDDYHGNFGFRDASSLIMIDGVPVLDPEKFLAYDPLLVERVYIYPHSFFIGSRGFSGAANFVTYKKNLPGITMRDEVKVFSYEGVCYPESYRGTANTLFWHPQVVLEDGVKVTVESGLPHGSGKAVVKVEGLTSSGKPVFMTREMVL